VVQPSPELTVVDVDPPLLPAVATLLPSPECTVAEFPPVVKPETLPPPAVTELVMLPDGGLSPGLRCTILHPPLLTLLVALPPLLAALLADVLTSLAVTENERIGNTKPTASAVNAIADFITISLG